MTLRDEPVKESALELAVIYRALLEIRQSVQDLREDLKSAFNERVNNRETEPHYREEIQIDSSRSVPMLPSPDRKRDLDSLVYEVESRR